MVDKTGERIYVEVAAKLLGVDWQIIDIPEPLDFEIRTEDKVFGLEVRRVFRDREKRFGSPSKRVEAENQRAVSMFANAYYKMGGRPVRAKFLGPICSSKMEAVVNRLLAACPSVSNGRKRLEVHGITVYLTALAPSGQGYRDWLYVASQVGWARRVTAEELQRAVDRKSENLRLYLKKYSTVDLLLVADRRCNSGNMKATDGLVVCNPGFRAIYFLSHPEKVVQIA